MAIRPLQGRSRITRVRVTIENTHTHRCRRRAAASMRSDLMMTTISGDVAAGGGSASASDPVLGDLCQVLPAAMPMLD
jgi:hypothetical protein